MAFKMALQLLLLAAVAVVASGRSRSTRKLV